MSQRRRYTAEEFQRAVPACRMTAESVALARAILVDGMRPATVAAKEGVSRQWASEAVRKMRIYIEQANPVPRGWKADVITLPNAAWPTVREMERIARSRLNRKNEL